MYKKGTFTPNQNKENNIGIFKDLKDIFKPSFRRT